MKKNFRETIRQRLRKMSGGFFVVCFLPILFAILSLPYINRAFERQNLELQKTIKFEGVVAATDKFTIQWGAGARSLRQQHFRIWLVDINLQSRQFIVFRVWQRYDDLAATIQQDDILIIHYWHTRRGFEAAQIEKDGNVILSIDDTNQQGRIVLTFWILLVLGCLLFLVGFVRGELRLSREGKSRSRKRRAG